MARARHRLLFEWGAYEEAFRAVAAGRGWSEAQIAAALQRDRLCSVEVEDLEAHLDWHQQLGFSAPRFDVPETTGPSGG